MKKVIQLIIASVLLFCCKDNLAQEKTVENSLQQKINSVNNPTNLKNEIDLISWELIDVTRFFNLPIEKSDYENFKNEKISFRKDTLIINTEKAIFFTGNVSSKKRLGKGSLYSSFTEYLLSKYNIDISKNYPFLDINNENAFKEPFRKYFSEGSVLYTDGYLFLYTNEDYLLVFKKKETNNFSKIYNSLPKIKLPIKSSFNNSNVFRLDKISDTYQQYLNLEDYSSEFKGAQLSKIGDEIYPILISVNDDGSGQDILLIYTLSNEFRVIDYLQLEYSYEIEDGNVQATFNIKSDYSIEITKTEYKDTSTKIIEIDRYKINDSGKFIKQE